MHIAEMHMHERKYFKIDVKCYGEMWGIVKLVFFCTVGFKIGTNLKI